MQYLIHESKLTLFERSNNVRHHAIQFSVLARRLNLEKPRQSLQKYEIPDFTKISALNCGFLEPQGLQRPGGCAGIFVNISWDTFSNLDSKLIEGIRAQNQNVRRKNIYVGDQLDVQFP